MIEGYVHDIIDKEVLLNYITTPYGGDDEARRAKKLIDMDKDMIILTYKYPMTWGDEILQLFDLRWIWDSKIFEKHTGSEIMANKELFKEGEKVKLKVKLIKGLVKTYELIKKVS